MKIYQIQSRTLGELPDEGFQISTEADSNTIIGDCYGLEIDLVVIPVSRLSADFLNLRTGQAGGFIQKFVTNRLGLVFLRDVSSYVATSNALRDFVRETNKGGQILFAQDQEELSKLLGQH